MKILLVAATGSEIKPLTSHFERVPSSGSLRSYSYCGHSIATLVTGIGMVATAYHLTKILQQQKYDLVLNIGIAGGFRGKCDIGDVLHIGSDCLTELGAEDGDQFLLPEHIGFASHPAFPFRNGVVESAFEIPGNILRKASGITVNTIHGNSDSIKRIVALFDPDTESMEGAAVMMVCNMEHTACAQIRAISNFVEARNKDNWNIPLALERLTDRVLRVMKVL